jgi:GT2 family glycosyltransferase
VEPVPVDLVGDILTTVRAKLPNGQPVFLHEARGNLGYAGGVNAALSRLADDPDWQAVWILNPDTKLDRNALAAALARLQAGGYGIVGSRLVLEATRRIHLYGGRWRTLLARGFNIGLGAPGDAAADVDDIERQMTYVCGAAMLVSRRFIEEIGLMDDRYFLYCEEVDWCLRRGRYRLGYAHDSIVYHGHGTTTGATGRHGKRSELSVYLGERNKLLLTKRFYRHLYPLVLISSLLLTSLYLAHRSIPNFRAALAGWLAGVRGEEGIPPRFRKSHGGANA